MLQHYFHIRLQAKQAAIRALEAQGAAPVLPEQGRRTGQSMEQTGKATPPNPLKTQSGPAWIRTRDRRIMSPNWATYPK